MNLTIQNSNATGVITLKEITDLIGARHNDSMKKVEDLAKESSFGSLRKTRSVYNDKGQEIDTYLLTKKQAIAVGAKLNNSLLMKVIDRLEELENQNKPKLMTPTEMILLQAQEFIRLESDMEVQKKRLDILEDTKVINTRQRKLIKDAIAVKVYSILETNNLPRVDAKTYFPKLHKYIRNAFNIDTYQELPTIRFNDCLNLIHRANLTEILR